MFENKNEAERWVIKDLQNAPRLPFRTRLALKTFLAAPLLIVFGLRWVIGVFQAGYLTTHTLVGDLVVGVLQLFYLGVGGYATYRGLKLIVRSVRAYFRLQADGTSPDSVA